MSLSCVFEKISNIYTPSQFWLSKGPDWFWLTMWCTRMVIKLCAHAFLSVGLSMANLPSTRLFLFETSGQSHWGQFHNNLHFLIACLSTVNHLKNRIGLVQLFTKVQRQSLYFVDVVWHTLSSCKRRNWGKIETFSRSKWLNWSLQSSFFRKTWNYLHLKASKIIQT